MGKLLLGIDIGTYSSKGVLCRLDGSIIAKSQISHNISIPKSGYAEHDADKAWWSDFKFLAQELSEKVPAGEKIAAVGVSAIGVCVLPVDKNGKPLRPGILYGLDTRSMSQIEMLEKKYSRKSLMEFGGSRLTTQAAGPKILWIKQNQPDIYKRAAKFITSTSYIIYKLTGKFVIDAHTATEFNPLVDINSVEWSDRFAGDIVDLDRLPEIGWSDEIAGYVTADSAKETGIPEGTPVNFGSEDAPAEAISVGVVVSGDLMIMYGSTAGLHYFVDDPKPTEKLWVMAGLFEGQYEYVGGLSTSGSATTWFRNQFGKDLSNIELQSGLNAYASLAKEAADSPIGANGLIMLPYMSGERTPIFDPKARGIISGLSLSHKRGDVYRSILEGTAYAIRSNLEAMQDAGAIITRAVAVGGGTSNELWLQMVSDITGVPQALPEKTIGASYGDAFLAGLASGLIRSTTALFDGWVEITKEIHPDPKNKRLYDRLYALFKELYRNTKSTVHFLTDQQA